VGGETLVGDLVVLGGELIIALKRGHRGIFFSEDPPLHLRSNFDLDFLLDLYLGLI